MYGSQEAGKFVGKGNMYFSCEFQGRPTEHFTAHLLFVLQALQSAFTSVQQEPQLEEYTALEGKIILRFNAREEQRTYGDLLTLYSCIAEQIALRVEKMGGVTATPTPKGILVTLSV